MLISDLEDVADDDDIFTLINVDDLFYEDDWDTDDWDQFTDEDEQ